MCRHIPANLLRPHASARLAQVARQLGYSQAGHSECAAEQDMPPEVGRRILKDAPLKPRPLPTVASLLSGAWEDGHASHALASEGDATAWPAAEDPAEQSASAHDAALIDAMEGLNAGGALDAWSDNRGGPRQGTPRDMRLSDAQMAQLLADTQDSVDAL